MSSINNKNTANSWEDTILKLNIADNFKLHLQVFLKEVERRYYNYLERLYGQSGVANKRIGIVIKNGRRYIKISLTYNVSRGTVSETLHSFIDKTNGDILLPASYSAPARIARGNIFINYGYEAFNNTGNADSNYQVRYLD